MRFGSVCSGIEAASVAWNPLGWEAAWFSEIDPFPCAVLKHRFPEVPNLGDMSTLPERILSGAVEAPDLLCGGTPCQAFSVAGKRLSLDDDRGNLSLVFCRIADAIDSARTFQRRRPSIVFWENVPGVLSTKDNAFGCFLAELVGSNFPLSTPTGRWPSAGVASGPKRQVAWRVLDAQHFGVPQRRKRVFVIASARKDFSPPQILFECQGVRGNSAQSGNEREDLAAFAEGSFGTFRRTPPLATLKASGGFLGGGSENLVCYDMTHASDVIRSAPTAPTLLSRMGTGGNQIPIVISHPQGAAMRIYDDGKTGALTSTNSSAPIFLSGPVVRRLTPIECERLQGFPDNWTKIPYRGKSAEECPDSPRYKAIGNSWAVPCVAWIGKRIDRENLSANHTASHSRGLFILEEP